MLIDITIIVHQSLANVICQKVIQIMDWLAPLPAQFTVATKTDKKVSTCSIYLANRPSPWIKVLNKMNTSYQEKILQITKKLINNGKKTNIIEDNDQLMNKPLFLLYP